MKKIAPKHRIQLGAVIDNLKKDGLIYEDIPQLLEEPMSTSTVRRIHKEYLQYQTNLNSKWTEEYKAAPWYKKIFIWFKL